MGGIMEKSFKKIGWRKNLSGEIINENDEKKHDQWNPAFTFVETLAVLAITAVLTAGCTVSISKFVSLAKKTSARNQIEQFGAALQSYFLDCGRFPTTEQGLDALWEKPVLYPIPENWNGPYLDRKPGNDPWGTDYKYLSSESSIMPSEVPEKLPFVIFSCGPDGREENSGWEKGGSDDICSWK